MRHTLVILVGHEGTGKTTLVKALLPLLVPKSASFDAEDILQIHPFIFNAKFQTLAIQNSLSLIHNFFDAGYSTVAAGSFLNDIKTYAQFRKQLQRRPKVYVVMLTASKKVRDKRRIEREKPTTKYWRDWLDKKYPQDTSLGKAKRDYTYIEIDSSALTVAQTLRKIKENIPEIFK